MKQPKLHLTPKDKVDDVMVKRMQEVINFHYDKYKKVIDKIVVAKMVLRQLYGVETPDHIWEDIVAEVVNLDLEKENL